MESDFIHLCYHLLFFLPGTQMSPKKGLSLTWKVLLTLVKKIWQWCQGVILIPTPDFSGERRGFQAVADARRSCSTSQTEKPGKNQARVSSTRDGFTRHMLWLKTTQNGYCKQYARELQGPGLVLLHISQSTRKKKGSWPILRIHLSTTHHTKREKDILTCGMKSGIINSVFPFIIKQKDWMTERVVPHCLSLFR